MSQDVRDGVTLPPIGIEQIHNHVHRVCWGKTNETQTMERKRNSAVCVRARVKDNAPSLISAGIDKLISLVLSFRVSSLKGREFVSIMKRTAPTPHASKAYVIASSSGGAKSVVPPTT